MVFGLTPTLGLAAVAVLFAHLGGGGQWTLSTYGLQRIVPDRIRGRVFSFDFALVTLTLAISSAVAAWTADHFGPRPAAVGMGALALAWALAWWLATRAIRHVPLVIGAEQASGEEAAARAPRRSRIVAGRAANRRDDADASLPVGPVAALAARCRSGAGPAAGGRPARAEHPAREASPWTTRHPRRGRSTAGTSR